MDNAKTDQFDGEIFLSKILDEANIGILILEKSSRELLFSNNYYTKIAGNKSQFIIEKIFNSTNSGDESYVQNSIEIDENIILEFTICSVKGMSDRLMVLISDISLKNINMEIIDNEKYFRKLSNFTSEIAHEAGNPLTSIIMTLQVLLSNLNEWKLENCEEYLNTSINELKRLSSFIKRIRSISTDQRIQEEETELKSLIQMVILNNKTELEKKKININYDINENTRVLVDPDRLNEIFLNLLNNSIEILTYGKGNINIYLEKVNEFFVKLIYENNGPSLSDKMLQRIFMPTLSRDNSTRAIGLDHSLKLMTRMGGIIKVENMIGDKGVRFLIYIKSAK